MMREAEIQGALVNEKMGLECHGLTDIAPNRGPIFYVAPPYDRIDE